MNDYNCIVLIYALPTLNVKDVLKPSFLIEKIKDFKVSIEKIDDDISHFKCSNFLGEFQNVIRNNEEPKYVPLHCKVSSAYHRIEMAIVGKTDVWNDDEALEILKNTVKSLAEIAVTDIDGLTIKDCHIL